MNNVEKRQTAFLNLEDYLYDILNILNASKNATFTV